ncbi:MAG: hypothetical protein IPO07_09990 [Haliscomenobacter sp.]|nr:hypothetical protein [Haliscomenobacter sp.]MBK9489088.1 hypothetical protein [Haliscomenobacter sp.]
MSTTNDTFLYKNTPLADTGYLQQNNITWDSTSGPHNLPVNLRLPHHQNFLTFHFTGTHLDNTNKTRYRYILEGADKAWSEISDKSYAEFRKFAFWPIHVQGVQPRFQRPLEPTRNLQLHCFTPGTVQPGHILFTACCLWLLLLCLTASSAAAF